jgi:hypothetical protein
MITIILLISALISIAGIVLMIRPSFVIGFIESCSDQVWVYIFAVGLRLVMGLLLIQQAAYSRFPLIIEIFGWVLLAAALFLAALGRKRFTRFIKWIIEKMNLFIRAGGLFAVAFGAFLIYAFV